MSNVVNLTRLVSEADRTWSPSRPVSRPEWIAIELHRQGVMVPAPGPLPDTFIERAIRVAGTAPGGVDASVMLSAFEATAIRLWRWREGR